MVLPANKSGQKTKKTKFMRIALILCICFIAFSLISHIFLITNTNHDCTGNFCSVCNLINNTKTLLKQIGAAAIGLFAVLMIWSLILSRINNILHNIFSANPIALKVKINK